jgi:hypothetical protein
MNAGAYSIPVYRASSTSDPVNTVTDGSSVQTCRVPADATPAVGTDATMDVIAPDHTTVDECWEIQRTGPTSWTCG